MLLRDTLRFRSHACERENACAGELPELQRGRHGTCQRAHPATIARRIAATFRACGRSRGNARAKTRSAIGHSDASAYICAAACHSGRFTCCGAGGSNCAEACVSARCDSCFKNSKPTRCSTCCNARARIRAGCSSDGNARGCASSHRCSCCRASGKARACWCAGGNCRGSAVACCGIKSFWLESRATGSDSRRSSV